MVVTGFFVLCMVISFLLMSKAIIMMQNLVRVGLEFSTLERQRAAMH